MAQKPYETSAADLFVRDAEIANARIDTHEAVCAERYKQLMQQLNDLKAMILASASDLQQKINSQGTDFHNRLNTISNRMWVLVTSSLGAVVLALGGVIFYLITHGK